MILLWELNHCVSASWLLGGGLLGGGLVCALEGGLVGALDGALWNQLW